MPEPIIEVIIFLLCLGHTSPVWVPIAFAAYIAGSRRQFSLQMLFVFVTLESIAFGIAVMGRP